MLDNSDCSIASDHLPILTSIAFSATQFSVPNVTDPSPAWHKANRDQLNTYLHHVDSLLDNTPLMDPKSSTDIDHLNTILTDILLNASKLAFPVKKFNPHTKPYWDNNVKSAHTEERTKRQIWIKEN